jgi:Ku70/Ku80 beta-barrel domain
MDGREALELMKRPIKKDVTPTGTKSELVLGTTLRIPVKVYAKTMEQKAQSAKKWSSLADSKEDTYDKGKVESTRTYVVVKEKEEGSDDEEDDKDAVDEEVPHDDLIHAYKYGKTLVPFAQDDEDAISLRTEKEMGIIGFTSMQNVLRFDTD